MSFQNVEDSPIEYYILEAAALIAVREGIQKREAHVKILETLSEWISYYEAALPVKSAYSKFKSGV